MKILSIDFDAIMFPCIKLYNNHCGGRENDTQIWNFLDERYNISNFLSYDVNLYKQITLLILNQVKQGANFVAIEEHDALVEYLKDNDLFDQNLDVTNIDFHHDIMYSKESLSKIKDFDCWTCADWLGYILLKNQENRGTWVRCPGSDPYQPEATGENFEKQFIIKNLRDLAEVQNEKFDFVFLCRSPQWVPYQYHHLYDIIVEIVNTIFSPEEKEDEIKEPQLFLIKGDEPNND